MAGVELFCVEKNPTVTPRSFSPVTWVCFECGKFSLLMLAWAYGGRIV